MLERDGVRAQMLLHRQRKIGAALDRRIVGEDETGTALDAADATDESRRRCIGAVHAMGRQRRELEKRTARIEQSLHALARQKLAARGVLAARFLGATAAGALHFRAQRSRKLRHACLIGAEALAAGLDLR